MHTYITNETNSPKTGSNRIDLGKVFLVLDVETVCPINRGTAVRYMMASRTLQ